MTDTPRPKITRRKRVATPATPAQEQATEVVAPPPEPADRVEPKPAGDATLILTRTADGAGMAIRRY